MNGYQYIINLFQAILDNSKAIQGRFYIGNRYGLQDINYDNLGQTFDKLPSSKKYPLCMMAPPHSAVKLTGKDDGWNEYRITMFFMKTSLQEGIATDTKTATHTIAQDWHDMQRCAIGFLRVLDNTMRTTDNKLFVFQDYRNTLIIPLSQVGADRISGVRIDFDFKLHVGCELEDYEEYPIINIESDGHPEHNL